MKSRTLSLLNNKGGCKKCNHIQGQQQTVTTIIMFDKLVEYIYIYTSILHSITERGHYPIQCVK